MSFFQDKTILVVISVIIMVLIIYWILQSLNRNDNEGFGNQDIYYNQQVPLEGVNEDIYIEPTYLDENGIIMSGKNYIPQKEIVPAWGEQYGVAETIDQGELSDGEGGNYTLATNICSPSCCSNQYPLPFELKDDKFVCNNKNEFIPSGYVCNNSWQNSGCMCITKGQAEFINNRGGNAN